MLFLLKINRGAIVKLTRKMIKKTNLLLFSLIASLALSPAYSVTVTKTYVDKQDKSLQSNILLLRDMLNAKDSSGNWITLDTQAKTAIQAINELKALIDSKPGAGDSVSEEVLAELNNAIAELESGKASVVDLQGLQDAVNALSDTFVTDEALTTQINAVKDMIPVLTEYVKRSELAPVAFSGSYNDLSDVPEGWVTSAQLDALRADLEAEIAKKQEAGDYAAADALQSVVTELGTLKADVYTKAEIDTKIADIVSGGKIDLSGYATTSALDALSQLVSGNAAEINALKEAGYQTATDVQQAISTAVSDLPYVTTEELEQKNYLTEQQAAQTYLTEENVNQFVELEDGAITADKLANGAITAAKLADGAVTVEKLADGAVVAEKINTGTGNAGEMVMLVSNGDGTSTLVPVSVVE